LKHLSFLLCNIYTIPEQMFKLIKLEVLNLSGNYINQVPSSISKLTGLTFLHLSQNKLTGDIPDTLSTLTNLKQLYLDRNDLSGQIPNYFGNFIHMNLLTLYGNPQLQIPPHGLLEFTVRWWPTVHHNFSFQTKASVKTLLMAQNTRKRKLGALFHQLPKDLLFEVFSWIVTQRTLRC
jgi:Leucine-rich repeat (LRR) protein